MTNTNEFRHSVRVNGLAQFVDLACDLSTGERDALNKPWYRGQSAGAAELAPTVLRQWFQQLAAKRSGQSLAEVARRLMTWEVQLNREFRRLGAALLPPHANLVDIYFLAQHHGLPTRLLDWSTNPLAALFFAARSRAGEDGMVLAMAPEELALARGGIDRSRRTTASTASVDIHCPALIATVRTLFGEEDSISEPAVLPVAPDLYAGRMLQQGSCFTLHTPGSQPINNGIVTRFVVPRERKASIERDLRSVGVTWATLFPDLDHVARELRAAWGLWPPESDCDGSWRVRPQ